MMQLIFRIPGDHFTDVNARWLWPMREGMGKWLTVQGYQIHGFPDVHPWYRPQSKAADDGNVVPACPA
jgi:hypothetical protein